MNYRYATILAEKSLGTKGTETIPLNIQDPISRIEIGYHPTLGDLAMAAALAAAIDKVELVDGSDVLHSLNGRQNQALCIYDRRVPTMNHGELGKNCDLYATMGIDFGRFLYDPELAFDPTKFRNPQLKITHDSTNISANTSTHSIEVFAHVFDERAISPIGFLAAKEHFVWTPTGADKYEYVDLPLDFPIRQILLRAHRDAQDPHDIVDYFKLSEDNDKRIPIDCELEAYIRRMKGVWQLIHEIWSEYGYTDNSCEKYVTPTDHMTLVTGTGDREFAQPYLYAFTKGGYVQIRASAACGQQYYQAVGYLPHHCIQFPFGRQDQLDDWYDVTRLGSLRARMMSAASCSTDSVVSLVLQQLRRY